MKLLTFTLVLLLSLAIVHAQEEIGAGIIPGSPFYGLELAFEKFKLSFLSPESKVLAEIDYSKERLAELQKLAEKQDTNKEHYDRAMKEYEQKLRSMQEHNQEIKDVNMKLELYKQIQANTGKHTIVLQELQGRLPAAAQRGIMNAIVNSQKYQDRIGTAITSTYILEKDILSLTPKQLEKEGMAFGVEGPQEAFLNARKIFLATGDPNAAAKAFTQAGGTLPPGLLDFKPKPIFEGETVYQNVPAEKLKEMAVQYAKSSDIDVEGSKEAFEAAQKAYMETKDPEKAAEAFKSAGGSIGGRQWP